MSGEQKGCAAIIQNSYPNAYYVHCANHNLNLAITHACKIPSVRNCITTMKEVVNLFRQSTKAGQLLKERIKHFCPSAKQTRLLKFCETRWVEHLNSLSLFYELFEYICFVLEELNDNNIMADGLRPQALLSSLQTSQFIITLTVIKPIFALTKNVSVQLQEKNCDLSRCLDFSKGVYEEIDCMRRNAEEEFKNIFKLSQEMANKVGVRIEVPRRVGHQINRDNYLGEPEDYYRCSIYIPFLDHYLDQIDLRFINHAHLLAKIQNILPNKAIELTPDDIRQTSEMLEKYWPNDFTSIDDFVAELTMWRRYYFFKVILIHISKYVILLGTGCQRKISQRIL